MGELRELLKSSLTPLVRALAPRRVDVDPSWWGLWRDEAGELCMQGVRLRELLARFGSPLHVVNAQRLECNAADFLGDPDGPRSGCEVYYSYKTNPVPGVLRRLHALGVGAEVISEYELWLALRLGVPPERIVYNGPCKSDASLLQAIELGVGLINLNSRSEISRVAALARRAGRRARVGLRVVTPGGWAGQFGERIDTGAALRAYAQAVTEDALEVVAVHAHLGFELWAAPQVEAFVRQVLDFADTLRLRLGLKLEVLDFGGSLACRTVSHLGDRQRRLSQTFGADLVQRAPQAVISIPEYVSCVARTVRAHYTGRGRVLGELPRIFLEPGRAMTGDTQLLLCTVHDVRDRDGTGARYAVLDAGMAIADPVPNELHQLFMVGRRKGPLERYRLAGPICTPADVLYLEWSFPELQPGDPLAIMDSGAYFVPFAASFSFPQPAVVQLDRGTASLLRARERFEHLVELDAVGPQPVTAPAAWGLRPAVAARP